MCLETGNGYGGAVVAPDPSNRQRREPESSRAAIAAFDTSDKACAHPCRLRRHQPISSAMRTPEKQPAAPLARSCAHRNATARIATDPLSFT